MSITRRALLGSFAAGAAFGPAFAAPSADGWPSRPVRLLSPYGAGGSNDISLRILAQQFEQRMGQKFVVENKPGASSTIANQAVARAEADGYTFLYAATPYATAEATLGHLNYDPRRDLRPIALAMLVPLFVVVNAKSPWKTLQEFVNYAKSKPDGVTFASPAAGSAPHLAAELWMRTAGFKGLAVHFQGDATSYTELLAERVDATTTAIPTALPHIKAGSLRVLGCFSAERSASYPDAPTLRELGQDVVAAAWFGFMAPAATPDSIIGKMQTEIDHALSDDSVKQRLSVQGLDPHYLPGPLSSASSSKVKPRSGPRSFARRVSTSSSETAPAWKFVLPPPRPLQRDVPRCFWPQAPATSISPPPIRPTPIQPTSGSFSPRKSQALAIRRTGARPSKA